MKGNGGGKKRDRKDGPEGVEKRKENHIEEEFLSRGRKPGQQRGRQVRGREKTLGLSEEQGKWREGRKRHEG